MVKLIVTLNDELNEKLSIFKIKNRLVSKDVAMIEILKQFFGKRVKA